MLEDMVVPWQVIVPIPKDTGEVVTGDGDDIWESAIALASWSMRQLSCSNHWTVDGTPKKDFAVKPQLLSPEIANAIQ